MQKRNTQKTHINYKRENHSSFIYLDLFVSIVNLESNNMIIKCQEVHQLQIKSIRNMDKCDLNFKLYNLKKRQKTFNLKKDQKI